MSDLGSNSISELPNEIANLKKLTTLDLDNNELHKIPFSKFLIGTDGKPIKRFASGKYKKYRFTGEPSSKCSVDLGSKKEIKKFFNNIKKE